MTIAAVERCKKRFPFSLKRFLDGKNQAGISNFQSRLVKFLSFGFPSGGCFAGVPISNPTFFEDFLSLVFFFLLFFLSVFSLSVTV